MREILFRGPEPAEGCQWCAICAMIFKAQVMEAAQAEMQFAMRADGAEPYWMDMEGIAKKAGISLPAEAVATAICTMTNGALTLVCWSHMVGLTVKNGTVVPAGPADMAAVTGQPVPLLRGR